MIEDVLDLIQPTFYLKTHCILSMRLTVIQEMDCHLY